MGWSGQTWIEIVQEGTAGANYGIFNAAPAVGQVLYPSIYGGNAFTARDVPQRQVIRTADAGNRRREEVASRHVFTGSFNTLLRPDEALYWLTAATTLTADANGHLWLPSYSFLFYDSIRPWRFLGGMCQGATLTSTAMQDYCSLAMNWIFQTDDPTFVTFAQPAESVYSTLGPYKHIETASNCTLGGTTITKYQNLNVTWTNVLAPTWDELPHISALYYCGRDLDFTFGPQYLGTANRLSFENQTALSFVLNWTRASPAHSLTVNCKTNSYISSLDDQLPLDGPAYQPATVQVFYDPSQAVDFSITVS
jgi:hypothetical protein